MPVDESGIELERRHPERRGVVGRVAGICWAYNVGDSSQSRTVPERDFPVWATDRSDDFVAA